MGRLIELSHGDFGAGPSAAELSEHGLQAMVIESVGPMRHEVNVPFHDSQVRGKAVLIQTGWDGRWGTESYLEPGPALSGDVIFRLVRSGVRMVGVDFHVARGAATRMILDGKIPIVENLQGLAALPRWGFRFCALPLEPPAGSSYAVRALAEVTG